MGFAIGHYVDGRFKLVTCGSKALTPTQQRYATIELECLAVHFAVTKCSFYLKGLPHFIVQPKNLRSTEPPSSTLGPPLSHVGLDIFEVNGMYVVCGSQHIVCVDQWSGYPLYQRMSSTTSASVIEVISDWFNTLGWPSVIQTDGGPQFRSEFVQFCEKNGISHELASPYNPVTLVVISELSLHLFSSR